MTLRKKQMMLAAAFAALLTASPALAQDQHGHASGARAASAPRSSTGVSRGNFSANRSGGNFSANRVGGSGMRSAQASQTRGNWRGHDGSRRGNGFGAGFVAGAAIGSSYPYGGYAYGDNSYGDGYASYGDGYATDDSYPGYNNGYASYGDGGYASGAYAAAPAVSDDDDDASCAQQFRSYDPRSGTYLGYDGMRHPCP